MEPNLVIAAKRNKKEVFINILKTKKRLRIMFTLNGSLGKSLIWVPVKVTEQIILNAIKRHMQKSQVIRPS